MPGLARSLLQRKRHVAAYACIRDAIDAGVPEREFVEEMRDIEGALGSALTAWKAQALKTSKTKSFSPRG